MLYYTIYKITNKINGKIYIGAHKTNQLDDGYMGSGTSIGRAIKKYGKDSFIKTIIELCETEEDMYHREREIVTEDFVKRRDTYNMKLGGPANFYYINLLGLNHKNNQHLKHGNRIKTDREYRLKFSEKMKQANAINKEKRRKAALGSKNSQYGSLWITDGVNNRKISSSESIPIGWHKGRIMPRRIKLV